jgi:hypothetical protein
MLGAEQLTANRTGEQILSVGSEKGREDGKGATRVYASDGGISVEAMG